MMNSAVRGKSARDPVDDVGDVGGAATDQDGHPGRRRERAARAAGGRRPAPGPRRGSARTACTP